MKNAFSHANLCLRPKVCRYRKGLVVEMRKEKYFQYFSKGNKGKLVVSLLATIIEAIMMAGVGIGLQIIMDVAAYGSARELLYGIILIVAYLVVFFSMSLIVRSTKNSFMEKALVNYKERLFDGILGKKISSFDEELTGKYVSNLTNDIQVIEENYLDKIYSLVTGIVTFLTSIGIMLFYDLGMFGITMGMCAVTMLVASLAGKDLEVLQEKVSKANGSLTAMLGEMFAGFAVIKSFQAEEEIMKLFTKQNQDTEKIKCERRKTEALVQIVAIALVTGSQVVIMVFGAWMVMKGELTVGVLVAFIQLMNSVMNPAQTIPADIANIMAARQIMRLHTELMEDVCEENVQTVYYEDYQIELKDVDFAYEDNKQILNKVNVSFEPKKSYAIVGASGSGKSTLLKILAGQIAGYEGQIVLGGNDLQKLDFAGISKEVTYISQKNFVFDSGIMENICMFKEFPQDKVVEAVRLAGLQEVMEKKGQNFTCGEGGNRLSGGECQRVAIARGLLRETPILLMDEVTASLDAQTSYQVEESLLGLKDYTRIVVSHKLNERLLEQYDSILAMKDGEIVECGSFAELMKKQGYFYSLYQVAH